MKSRKPFLFLLLCLVIASLASMTTTEPFVTYPADTPTLSDATATPTASAVPTETLPAKGDASQCALVTADEALHLRAYDDPKSQVLAYLENGDKVKLISTKRPEWWFIKHGDVLGYARSKYLEVSECAS